MLRRAVILGGLLVVLAAVGSVAWATTSASDKFVACAAKSSGALRLVGAAKNCKKTERAVSWSATGQPGPRGPAGARGPAGEDGADGIDGLDGLDGQDGFDGADGYDGVQGPQGPATKWFYMYSAALPVTGNTTTDLDSQICSGGTPFALNAGIKLDALPTVHVTATAPTGSGATATQWKVRVNNTGAATTATVWVLCANGVAGP